jgi:hypothetical protein
MTVASRFAPRVAVLIDAENVSHAYAASILGEIRRRGGTVEVSAYGSKAVCKGWMEQLKGLQPRRTTPQKTGKSNVVDMTIMLDAMVYVLREKVSHMCIVASDKDYIPLLRHLRELHCHTIVLGEEKSPKTLRKACDEFVLLKKA